MAFLCQFFVSFVVLLGLVNSLPHLHIKRSDSDSDKHYCPLEDSILETYPHPNCERFYKVQSGLTYEVNCPIETHFNKRTHCCEAYENAQCVYGKAPLRPDAIPENPSDDAPALPPPADDNKESYICSGEHRQGAYFAHPNCGRFYEQRHGTTFEMMCPTELQWNSHGNCCDEPRVSNCIFGMAPYRPNAVGL